ncbi:protein-disulfide reductase DsbD domain-containing protein [Bartonella sp. CB178]|uniref:protein-disulfide reductase DsbD domain-containing protein n=1 Tax=Bartonella sp. CB178 TaxID=3112255 RepID=UPI00300E0A32
MRKIQIFANAKSVFSSFRREFFVNSSAVFVFLGLVIFSANTQAKQKSYLFATPWYEAAGGRIRLAATKPSPSGSRDGVIEIVLKPGWKTYWRNPGNSGMAPSFSFDQKVFYEIFYPVPKLYETEDDWSFGYENRVMFPFRVSNSSKNLSGFLTLGLCNEICIPLTLHFNFSPSVSKNEHLPVSLLKDAQSSLPDAANHEFEINATMNVNALFIKIRNNKKTTPSSLFLDGGEMQIGPAKKINDNAEYTLFRAPVFSTQNRKNQTVFYVISFNERAFSGTFKLRTPQANTPPL